MIQVPTICPFKEDILKDVEVYMAQKEEEKRLQREAAKEQRKLAKINNPNSLQKGDLTGLVSNEQIKINFNKNIISNNSSCLRAF